MPSRQAGRPPDDRRKILWCFIAFALAVKLSLLAAFGPLIAGDSFGYMAVSDMILEGHVARVDLTEAIPANLFRIAGYPALLAAAWTLAGALWPWLTVLAQMALSALAFSRLYGLAVDRGLGPLAAGTVCLLPLLSQPLLLDQSILSDSFYSSIVILATCRLAEGLLTDRRLTPASALTVGMAVAAGFLLREGTVYLLAALMPLMAAAACQAPGTWPRRAVLIVCMVVPLLAVQQAYRAWNVARVGADIVTTGAQTTMFQALQAAALGTPDFWNRDDPVSEIAAETLRTDDFEEVRSLQTVLHERLGLSAIDIAKAGFSQYFLHWSRQPRAMLASLSRRSLRPLYAALWLAPVDSIRLMLMAADSPHRLPKADKLRGKTAIPGWAYPLLALEQVCKLLSYLVFAGFFLLAPYRAARAETPPAERLLMATVWLLFMGFFSIYALVHVETRYLAPVVPLSSLAGALNLAWMRERLSSARRFHKI